MISIIMPTYNRGYIIQRAIDSILAQTYSDWELIIVDDGSADDTEQVVAMNQDDRIRYIRYEENRGANHARNVGLKNARGKYLTFIDSDAIYSKESLSIRLKAAKEEEADVVWARADFVYLSGDRSTFPSASISQKTLNDRMKLVPLSLVKGLINTSTIFMARRCYEEIGGYDECIPRFQDWDFFWRLILHEAYKIYFVDTITVTNYIQLNSIMCDTRAMWEGYAYILKKHIDAFRRYGCLHDVLQWVLTWEDWHKYYEYVFWVVDAMTMEEEREFTKECMKKMAMLEREVIFYKGLKNKMEWHFPREKIPEGARIIIYGAGDVGTSFMKQMHESRYSDVVLWVDSDYKHKGGDVVSPERIAGAEFDYVLIAVYQEKNIREIVEYLHGMFIDDDKIILI